MSLRCLLLLLILLQFVDTVDPVVISFLAVQNTVELAYAADFVLHMLSIMLLFLLLVHTIDQCVFSFCG